jgi:hypothetical protein
MQTGSDTGTAKICVGVVCGLFGWSHCIPRPDTWTGRWTPEPHQGICKILCLLSVRHVRTHVRSQTNSLPLLHQLTETLEVCWVCGRQLLAPCASAQPIMCGLGQLSPLAEEALTTLHTLSWPAVVWRLTLAFVICRPTCLQMNAGDAARCLASTAACRSGLLARAHLDIWTMVLTSPSRSLAVVDGERDNA